MAEYLTAPTIDGKVQQFIGVLIQLPAEEIDNSYDFKSISEGRVEYFDIMMAEALTTYFNVPTEVSDIEAMNTVQDIVNRVNNA
ncbi:unnamed protein product [Caenorhabditis brenneri]